MVYVTPLTADDIPHFKEVEKGGGEGEFSSFSIIKVTKYSNDYFIPMRIAYFARILLVFPVFFVGRKNRPFSSQ